MQIWGHTCSQTKWHCIYWIGAVHLSSNLGLCKEASLPILVKVHGSIPVASCHLHTQSRLHKNERHGNIVDLTFWLFPGSLAKSSIQPRSFMETLEVCRTGGFRVIHSGDAWYRDSRYTAETTCALLCKCPGYGVENTELPKMWRGLLRWKRKRLVDLQADASMTHAHTCTSWKSGRKYSKCIQSRKWGLTEGGTPRSLLIPAVGLVNFPFLLFEKIHINRIWYTAPPSQVSECLIQGFTAEPLALPLTFLILFWSLMFEWLCDCLQVQLSSEILLSDISWCTDLRFLVSHQTWAG